MCWILLAIHPGSENGVWRDFYEKPAGIALKA